MDRVRRLYRHVANRVTAFPSYVETKVPPGARTVLGLLLVALGVFGFLPVLGFWMIPLGLAIILTDIRWLWHALRRRR